MHAHVLVSEGPSDTSVSIAGKRPKRWIVQPRMDPIESLGRRCNGSMTDVEDPRDDAGCRHRSVKALEVGFERTHGTLHHPPMSPSSWRSETSLQWPCVGRSKLFERPARREDGQVRRETVRWKGCRAQPERRGENPSRLHLGKRGRDRRVRSRSESVPGVFLEALPSRRTHNPVPPPLRVREADERVLRDAVHAR